MTALSDDELLARVQAYQEHGSYRRAAEALGIDESSVRGSVRRASSRNLTGDFLGGKPAEGYTIGQVTRYVTDDGRVAEWQRHWPEAEAVREFFDQLIDAFKQEVTPLAPIEYVDHGRGNPDWLTLYPIVDVHLGQHSWANETGESYDLKIAERQLKASVSALVAASPMAEKALIVFLGDYFHANDGEAQTKKSKNHLDVDGRHDKVLHKGIEIAVWIIDMALQKHAFVEVHVCKGNHDEDAATALREALYWRYHQTSRVKIDLSPRVLWVYQHGKTMLGFTHGDKLKAEEMPGAMAGQFGVMWGDTVYRYGYSGHFHRSKKGPKGDEKNGAIWEIFPAFTAKDAFNAGIGGSSLRTLVSKTFSKETGLKTTIEEHV